MFYKNNSDLGHLILMVTIFQLLEDPFQKNLLGAAMVVVIEMRGRGREGRGRR